MNKNRVWFKKLVFEILLLQILFPPVSSHLFVLKKVKKCWENLMEKNTSCHSSFLFWFYTTRNTVLKQQTYPILYVSCMKKEKLLRHNTCITKYVYVTCLFWAVNNFFTNMSLSVFLRFNIPTKDRFCGFNLHPYLLFCNDTSNQYTGRPACRKPEAATVHWAKTSTSNNVIFNN